MKRLDLYIFRECLPTFFLSLAVFSFVMLVQKLADMFDLVVAKGVPVWEVLRLLGLIYPSLLSVVMPVSLLLAVLLAMGRLSSDSEMVVMRACGVSLFRNLRPIVALSAIVALLCLAITLWLGPAGRMEFKLAALHTIATRLNVSAEEKSFTELAPGVWLYANSIGEDGLSMEGMFLHTEVGKLAGTVVSARQGRISAVPGGFELSLTDAEFHQAREDGGYTKTTARSGKVFLPISTNVNEADELTVREATTSRLYQQAFSDKYRRAEMELYKRFTVPISCLMLGLLGGALGCHHFRSGNSRGMMLCLLVLFVNYSLFTVGDALANRNALPVPVAMWIPDAALAALAVWAVAQKNRERELSLETLLNAATLKLRTLMAAREKSA